MHGPSFSVPAQKQLVMAVSPSGQRPVKMILMSSTTESVLGWPIGPALFWSTVPTGCIYSINYEQI